MMTDNINESADLEEGECSDQDDVGMSTSEAVSVPQFQPIGYRQGSIPQIIINSDQSDQNDSDDDDDGDYLSHGKRSCNMPHVQSDYTSSQNFVNPLRSPEMAQAAIKKRRNNVWGAVMTEQILSNDIKQFGVNAPLLTTDRDVESYDFSLSKQDDRPDYEVKESTNDNEDIFGSVVDLEKEVKRQQNRKRKRNIKERLGTRSVPIDDTRRLDPLNITDNTDSAAVTQAIVDAMQEQNIVLFTRIVDAIGTEKAIDLYNKTLEIENSGGMMINNGFRRRTPGGVYIQLLKSESSIPEDVVTGIFQEEQQKWMNRQKEIRNIKRAARRHMKKNNKRLDMDFDRPETPTPTKELEDLDSNDNNGNEVDVDVSDLPDRPDTPEPNDSSDNVQSEQDEEEEDIAVVIAKAKAAIFKKQREMAENQSREEGNSGDVDESVEMS